jgi:transposase
VDLREVRNAIRYLAPAGVGRRMLPHDVPPWVDWWFRRFVRRRLVRTLHDVALLLDRERVGRAASPSVGALDSPSGKAPQAPGGGGCDAAKKVKGRRRHVVVDTDGRRLMVNRAAAEMPDAAGAEHIVAVVRQRWPLQGC